MTLVRIGPCPDQLIIVENNLSAKGIGYTQPTEHLSLVMRCIVEHQLFYFVIICMTETCSLYPYLVS